MSLLSTIRSLCPRIFIILPNWFAKPRCCRQLDLAASDTGGKILFFLPSAEVGLGSPMPAAWQFGGSSASLRVYSDFSLFFVSKSCIKEGLLHSSKTKAAQSMRKAYRNFTNSLLKFKSFIKGCEATAINFGVSFSLIIAFKVALALDQGNFILYYLSTARFCLHIN